MQKTTITKKKNKNGYKFPENNTKTPKPKHPKPEGTKLKGPYPKGPKPKGKNVKGPKNPMNTRSHIPSKGNNRGKVKSTTGRGGKQN